PSAWRRKWNTTRSRTNGVIDSRMAGNRVSRVSRTTMFQGSDPPAPQPFHGSPDIDLGRAQSGVAMAIVTPKVVRRATWRKWRILLLVLVVHPLAVKAVKSNWGCCRSESAAVRTESRRQSAGRPGALFL